MKKRKSNYSSLAITVLSLAIILMSVGFAAYTSNLTINGTATVKKAEWKVNFDTDSYAESTGSISVASANRSISATAMTYTVTLDKPGDYYEFTIDVANEGTFDADLTGITLSSISDHSKYLSYTVTYGSTAYTTTNTSISGVTLSAGASETVKVRVEYIKPTSASDLPAEDKTSITLNCTLSFAQSE